MKKVMTFLNTPILGKGDMKKVVDFMNTPILGKEKGLSLRKVKVIAKSKGIDPNEMDMSDIIRTIQRTEGNFDCYGSADSGNCDQSGCSWRRNCLKP